MRTSTKVEHGERLDRRLVALAAVLTLGTIMPLVDSTAVNVAFNTLRHRFGAPLPTAQWVLTGYLLATAVVVPVTGWAVARFGPRRVWTCALGLFVVGSALCGLAGSIESLIAFRVLQGLGGGMIIPVAHTVLATAAGPGRLGRAMSILSVTTTLGPVIGPVIGGVLVQYAGWQWIFYVNIPLGAAGIVAAARLLPGAVATPAGTGRLDVVGLVLISAGVTGLVYGLAAAGDGGSGATAGGSVLLGAVLLAVFAGHARARGDSALLRLRVFAARAFAPAAAFLFLGTVALFGTVLLLPLYFQVVRGEDAMAAGLLIAPQGIGVALLLPFAGAWTDRFGARAVILPGLALTALSTVVCTQLTAGTAVPVLAGVLVLRGIGIGCMLTPAVAAALGALPQAELAGAASTLTVLRQIGSSVGTALLAVTLTHELALTPSGAAAFDRAFWVVLGLTALAAGPALLLPRTRRAVAR